MFRVRKGFTLVELVVSMCIVAILTGCTFIVPKLVYDTRYTVDTYMDYTEEIKLLYTAIQKDLSKDLKIIEVQDKQLIINNVIYTFTEEGVYRQNDGVLKKLTNRIVYYEIGDEIFRVYTSEDSNNNKIDLKFNLDFTTIQKGRI